MNAKQILSTEEVVKALDLDNDFDEKTAKALSQRASNFLLLHTGKDWGADEEVEPLAKQCAEFLCAMFYRNDKNFQASVDYLMADLKDIVMMSKIKKEN